MKIVIPGGSGQVGTLLARAFSAEAHEVVILSRNALRETRWRTVQWDAIHQGAWSGELDGADVVINLAGRSVDCRYNERNRAAMKSSRVLSTQAVGAAIAAASSPPLVWLNSSTATI